MAVRSHHSGRGWRGEINTLEQLILHLVGDYVTQSDWMAAEKTEDDSLLGPFGHLDSY